MCTTAHARRRQIVKVLQPHNALFFHGLFGTTTSQRNYQQLIEMKTAGLYSPRTVEDTSVLSNITRHSGTSWAFV
jgi:hypothetical protein